VFRGQKPIGVFEAKLNYVAPIHDVFEDIKAFSEGGITDIRIASIGGWEPNDLGCRCVDDFFWGWFQGPLSFSSH